MKKAAEVDTASAACVEIAVDLDATFPLKGKTIQIIDNNIKDRQTDTILPFSKILGDGFSREFSKLGAEVTVRRAGVDTLIFLASYTVSGNMVIIDGRLRQVQRNMKSTEVAISEAALPLNSLPQGSLTPTLETQADLLSRKLAENYTGRGFALHQAKSIPGIAGQPSMVLGIHFDQALKEALATNQRMPVSFSSRRKITLHPTYTLSGQDILLKASLFSSSGKPVSTASVKLPKRNVSPELFRPMATSSQQACVKYMKVSKNDMGSGSQEAAELMSGISGFLQELAIQPSCSNGKNRQVIATVSQLPVATTKDNYKFTKIRVSVRIEDPTGNLLGEYKKQASQPFTNDQIKSNVRAVSKTITLELKNKLTKTLLSELPK